MEVPWDVCGAAFALAAAARVAAEPDAPNAAMAGAMAALGVGLGLAGPLGLAAVLPAFVLAAVGLEEPDPSASPQVGRPPIWAAALALALLLAVAAQSAGPGWSLPAAEDRRFTPGDAALAALAVLAPLAWRARGGAP